MSYNDDFADGLQKMRGSEKFCDVVLLTEDVSKGVPKVVKFPCHKVVLAALSEYFETMFDSPFKEEREKEINIELSPKQCGNLLDFIYTGQEVWDTVDEAIDMLHISQMYQIHSLKEQCLEYLLKNIDKKYCIRMWEVAKLLELKDLEEKSSVIISKEFALVSVTEEFLELNRVDFIVELLEKRDLNAQEETIVKAGLSWIESDFENREVYSRDICQALQTNRTLLKSLVTDENFPQLNESDVFRSAMDTDIIYARSKEDRNRGSVRLDIEECFVILGGNDEGSNRNVICFGFRQKKWLTLPPIPYDPKLYFSVCTHESKIYVSGGFGKGSGFCVYDGENNAWSLLPDLISPRQNHCMASSCGKIVILGGTDAKNNSKFIKEIDVFDTATNRWSETRTTLDQEVRSSASCVLDDKIFLIGGFCPNNRKAEKLQYYDMSAGYSVLYRWCTIPEQIRLQARAVVVNNTLFIISKEGVVFSLKRNRGDYSFDRKGNILQFPRKGFGVCEFDGRILIVGGEKDLSKTKDMIQYKPEENFTFMMEETLPLSMSNFYYGRVSVKREYLTNECENQLMPS
ncbi:kelch-like protein 24 [Saccostrea echinata]|uniref:kelch-like protein 24 n=1 Tax=Saccostrea echinata TaxID=191078 RepID=UPI002A805319|nr:kelch-like protein 24 [Saccostrea echinata]